MKNKTCGECKIARPSGRQGWMYCPRKHDTVLSEAGQCKTPYTTNGDKLRQMSDAELVDAIEELAFKFCSRRDFINWLQQETKDE
jgi:hypothetical protein